MAAAKTAKSEGLVYNGHPLRRKDNLIYYGRDAKDYPKVADILQIARRQWSDERDEEFFKGIYERLGKAI